jgi:uncharacterized protein (TIGR02996 family)
MSDESALLRAITANAGDDTPRLVYADWLDENEAPLQAEFIRVQCRLAQATAADPDYPDLLERHAELVAQFRPMVRVTVPELPDGFAYNGDLASQNNGFRRGFLYTVFGKWSESQFSYNARSPTDDELDRVAEGLAPLVANTTARALVLDAMTPDALARVLVAPGADALTGLTLSSGGGSSDDSDALIRALAAAKSAGNLEHLALNMSATAAGVGALGANFKRLRSLDAPALGGFQSDLPRLTQAPWFAGLRRARLGAYYRPLQEPLLTALAKLPHLEALSLRFNHATAHNALASAGGFAALVSLSCTSVNFCAAKLARGKFPRLTELSARELWPPAFAALLGAKWLPQLRLLDVSGGGLTDASITALANGPAAAHLRVLRIGYNPFGKPGLTALADGTRFPNLTTLDLRTGHTGARPATLAAFAKALALPRVRHLHLDGWPLGDVGAKALAANPALANLTRLTLARCGITDPGLTGLARSPHLQGLIELDLSGNKLKRAAALLDAGRLPRLAALGLTGNPLTAAAGEQLHRARGWLV